MLDGKLASQQRFAQWHTEHTDSVTSQLLHGYDKARQHLLGLWSQHLPTSHMTAAHVKSCGIECV